MVVHAITRSTNLENVYLIDYDEYEEDEKDLMNYLQKRSIGISSKIKRRKGRWIPRITLPASGSIVVWASVVRTAVRA